MELLQLNRLEGLETMPECLEAMTNGSAALMEVLPEVCRIAINITMNEAAMFRVLDILDTIEVYDHDMFLLFSFCNDDPENILIIIWSIEVGLHLQRAGYDIQSFCKPSTIHHLIKDLSEKKQSHFPFDEAKKFIEQCSSIRF